MTTNDKRDNVEKATKNGPSGTGQQQDAAINHKPPPGLLKRLNFTLTYTQTSSLRKSSAFEVDNEENASW